mgnify:CR=1 FL=1
MEKINLGYIVKINGSSIVCSVNNNNALKNVSVDNFNLSFISVGALAGTRLVDGRVLVVTIEEIYDHDNNIFFNASINGIYDDVLKKYSFGTNSYPLINEAVFKLDDNILKNVFDIKYTDNKPSIGKYFYNESINIFYNPNIIFGKHLGVFGNTGSGKTCTVVSLIQNFVRTNPDKNIKFIILDVNGEYKTAFNHDEYVYFNYEDLRFNHHILNNVEYGKLFRASEGIQYPALKDSIRKLEEANPNSWLIKDLLNQLNEWVNSKTPNNQYSRPDIFTNNQITGFLRTLIYRIEQVLSDDNLLKIIDSPKDKSTLEIINESDKKIFIFDLQTSLDSLDIILYLFFKSIYNEKSINRTDSHTCLVLEEAHRYINANISETQLGTYYIDKLAREGRKFGIGLVISSQVPSMLSYEIVSQCNTVIMHKITNKRDLEFLRGVMRVSNDSFFLQMSSLEKQYAIVCGEAFSNDTIVKITDAYPLPRSSDPIITTILKCDK